MDWTLTIPLALAAAAVLVLGPFWFVWRLLQTTMDGAWDAISKVFDGKGRDK